mmetsp:Transcript_3304/g.7361  ORF Transcript_3304/g.7361 Transcript_3304/m.7361 type:complete len:218 (-) Transcript_3304:1107-1760(-)
MLSFRFIASIQCKKPHRTRPHLQNAGPVGFPAPAKNQPSTLHSFATMYESVIVNSAVIFRTNVLPHPPRSMRYANMAYADVTNKQNPPTIAPRTSADELTLLALATKLDSTPSLPSPMSNASTFCLFLCPPMALFSPWRSTPPFASSWNSPFRSSDPPAPRGLTSGARTAGGVASSPGTTPSTSSVAGVVMDDAVVPSAVSDVVSPPPSLPLVPTPP